MGGFQSRFFFVATMKGIMEVYIYNARDDRLEMYQKLEDRFKNCLIDYNDQRKELSCYFEEDKVIKAYGFSFRDMDLRGPLEQECRLI